MSNIFYQNVPYITGSLLNSFTAQEILNHHNMARQEVGVQPLAWSTKLANYAQQWAEYLSVYNHCTMKHSVCKDSEGNSLGENLWWGSSSDYYKPIDSSIGWLSEKKDYYYQEFGKQTPQPIGHYTQMVWKTTREMGVGIAYCSTGGLLVVANYFPAGNWIGEYPY